MSKKNPQKSTRNTEFNSFIDNNNFINSVTSVTATKSNPNIRLLDYMNYIKKNGTDIITDANNNHTMTDNGYDIKINTDNIEDSKDYYIYGAPHKMVLDNHQLYSNCGVDSALNVLVIAGLKTITNQDKTETTFTKELWTEGLCSDSGVLGKFDNYDGGTSPNSLTEIFKKYDLVSKGYAPEYYSRGISVDGLTISLLEVANIVRKGGSAVVGVSSARLWKNDETDLFINHAVAVTGVVYSNSEVDDTTIPIGFYIHDTGGWMTRYISYSDMQFITFAETIISGKKDIKGVLGTVVTDVIKQNTDNINATGNKNNNIIYGNSSNNVIKGIGGVNILVGGEGNDTIYGGSGSDTIYANNEDGTGSGANTLYGGAGKDTIYGGNDNDLIYGDSGNDIIYGYNGIDAIYGGKGKDTIYGGEGNDRISGGADDDVLYGEEGFDTIIGGAGNDTICAGAGDDIIECGSGKDTVIFNEGDGADIMTSSSGSVKIKFPDYDISEISFYMEKYTSKHYTLVMALDEYNGIEFDNFLKNNSNSCKTAYIEDENNNSYRLGATSASGKVKVKSTNCDNIFLSMSTKNNTITTSVHNDRVYMLYGDDKITYTGGDDVYVSFEGNDTYIANKFDRDTILSVEDSISAEKTSVVSLEDTLKLNCKSSDFSLFFDMEYKDEKMVVTDNADMFLINMGAIDTENFKEIVDGEGTGFVKINKYNGNGKIEYVYTNDSTNPYNMTEKINEIRSSVLSWFNDYGAGYSTVFEAIQDSENQHLDTLISAYTNSNV